MKRISALGALASAVLLAAAAGSTTAGAGVKTDAAANGPAVTRSITIWTDKDRRAAVTRIAGAWAARRGVAVNVVEKDFGKIRDDLKTVQLENAADVIVGAHDWVGQLAADGSIVQLFPRSAVKSQFPKYALNAFSYGRTTPRLYGAPVALENLGLVVNTRLARVPKSFADLQKQALAFKKKAAGNLAIAVPQAPAGDAYHMYPFFSGLCGYVFGTTKSGAVNPRDVGLASKRFLANAGMIDTWNRLGLINSKVDYNTAKDAFLKGKAAFWITGPWESDTLKSSSLRFRVVGFPKIKCQSVPFLGVQGFMVTRFANQHGVATLAKDLVSNYMMNSDSQKRLAAANHRYPANMRAGKFVKDSVLQQFGRASTGGVPMPNIPQMSAVWSEFGNAWLVSTKGSGATKAANAFRTAARNIAKKIASGG